jgi:site-specific recombinase XerD
MTEIERLLGEYLDHLEIEKNRSPKTRENYERYLRAFLAHSRATRPREVTAEAVRTFRLSLARRVVGESGQEHPLKKVTQSYYVIAIRNFLKYLVKRGIPGAVAPETIELPKVSRRDIEVLEYRELERLLAAPDGSSLRSVRDRAILETFFSTGLRLSELCSLPRTVDLTRGEFSVRGKGDKLRVVFLADSAKSAIREYLKRRTDAEPALFISISKSGKPMGRITPRAVERLVEHYAKAAGISKRVHPHQLRHSYATDLLVNGADIRSVQELLGHANIATTQVYTHLTNKELKEVHRAFHARRRKTDD